MGEPLTLTVDRDGATVELKAVPEALPGSVAPAPPAADRPVAEPEGPGAASALFGELGIKVAEINPGLIRLHRLRDGTNGLVVVGVDPDGPADKGGVEIGMVVLDAAGMRVTNLAEFRRALAARPGDRDLLLRVLRAGKAEFRVVFDKTDPARAGEAAPPLPGKPLE